MLSDDYSCFLFFFFFFFFKQKTAYEMRISDWSSDVCSSDLHGNHSLVGNHGDAVADCIKRVQIMCDEEYGKTQRALQFFRLVIESSSADRVQPRRRLVQKQEIRVKRQGTGQSGSFFHSS